MTKRLLPLLMAASALTMAAAPLTPEQALQRVASSQMRQKALTSLNAKNLRLAYTMNSESGNPAIYIFNRTQDNGYMLLSADDASAPVLGYTDSGSFDEANMSPSMKWWLSQYAGQIEYASGKDARYASTRAVSGGAISPMLKTRWNQSKPYNSQCPQIGGVNCVTGCVATAMAQVMAYHKYPVKGTGTVSVSVGSSGVYSLDLSQEEFQWNNMLDSYVNGSYTEAQANAVAYLMKACGYSVGMSYSTVESGAVSMNMGTALINNFNYNKNLSYEERKYYTTTEWEQMVYDELKGGRPVLYGGLSEGGGHQFVCDGYDGNGYFHINWGWGGLSDGYFLLQSLNPDDLGIGGGTGGGYSFNQDILVGVQPAEMPGRAGYGLRQSGILTGNKTSASVIAIKANGSNAGWWNMGYNTAHVNFGVIVEGISNPSAGKVYVTGQRIVNSTSQTLSNLSLAPKYGISGDNGFTFNFPTSLGDGTYKVTVAYRDLDESGEVWYPVSAPLNCSNSFTVVKSGSSYSLTWEKAKMFTVVDANVLTPLYLGSNSKISISLKNETNVELTETVYPVLYKQGENQFIGEGVSVSLMPGESVTKEFVTNFEALKTGIRVTTPTTYSLRFYNKNTDSNFDNFKKDVTLNPTSSPMVTYSNLTVPGASTTTMSGQTAYVINPNEIPLEGDVTCALGYFGNNIVAFIFAESGGSSLTYCDMSPAVFLSAGEQAKVTGTMMFEGAQEGKLYFICLFQPNGSSYAQMSGNRLYVTPQTSAVNELFSDGELVVAYNKATDTLTASSSAGIRRITVNSINGYSVWSSVNPEGMSEVEQTLANLQPGVYVAVAEDCSGKTKVLKFVK